ERAFDDAHILVGNQVVDVGAVEQGADRRDQHDIIGSNQFPQLIAPLSPRAKSMASLPLPQRAALSIVRKSIANVETGVAVIVPFENPQDASIEALVGLVAADMERVNATILSRTGSDVTMIPEVANHLISSGGKRLRPMLTLAMAGPSRYPGPGPLNPAAVPR